LQPFLDVRLPDGVGMTFNEEMTGWYFPGQSTPAPGRAGDLTIDGLIPATGDPAGGVPCSFQAAMTIADVNEFVDGFAHEARLDGTIKFGQFADIAPATFTMDGSNSRFNYLRTNPQTGEAEMRYHIEFPTNDGRRYIFEGVKYMQRDSSGGIRNVGEILQDYTTLYCHVYQQHADGSRAETGLGYLKFRTFESLAAVGNLAGFLASFQVTGTGDPVVQLQARLRFLAFTAQFVEREYDPLGFGTGQTAATARG
jgi:hypothetical protein